MELNKIFSNGMVFQAGEPIRFFGTGKGLLHIEFCGVKKVQECKDDKWLCEFEALDYGGPYTAKISLNNQITEIENIYIGEVLLLSGQSNMEFKIYQGKNNPNELIADSNIRYFEVNPDSMSWEIVDNESIQKCSAVGYYIARQLSIIKNVKIGLVGCYKGASVIESWIDSEILASHKELTLPTEDKFIDHISPQYAAFNKDGFLYRSKILQIVPFSLGGVIWYQGESDATVKEAQIYDKEVAVLIDLWRKQFKNSDLRFVIVQIADCMMRDTDGWRAIQAAQKRVCENVTLTYFVKSADVCETDNIHPPTKSLLGKRIAQTILQW